MRQQVLDAVPRSAYPDPGEAVMDFLRSGRSEVLLGFYVIAWMVALVVTHIVAR